MKARFLTVEALHNLKTNIEVWGDLFAEPTNDKLFDELEKIMPGKAILKETKWDLPEAQLIPSKASEDELANVRVIYGGMRDVPPAVAMDERLWAGLALGTYWRYVQERWEIREYLARDRKKGIRRAAEHYLFMHNARRSFTRNAISRLWWLGKLTFDEDLSDPYYRTGVVMHDLGYIVDLLERNFSNNPRISREFIDAVEAARKEVAPLGLVILRPELRTLCKYLNTLGGVYVLDMFPPGGISVKIKAKALSIARAPTKKESAAVDIDDEPPEDDDEV